MFRFDAWVEFLDVKVLNEEDTKIINHTCNSVLSYNGKIWTKKDQNSTFAFQWDHLSVLNYMRPSWPIHTR